MHLDEAFFDGVLRKQNAGRKGVFVLTVDGGGKAYLQTYKERSRTFHIPLPEGAAW